MMILAGLVAVSSVAVGLALLLALRKELRAWITGRRKEKPLTETERADAGLKVMLLAWGLWFCVFNVAVVCSVTFGGSYD